MLKPIEQMWGRGLLAGKHLLRRYSAAILLLLPHLIHNSAAWLCFSKEYRYCQVNLMYDSRMENSLGSYLGYAHHDVKKYLKNVIGGVNKIYYQQYLGGCTILQFRILAMTDISKGYCARNWALCHDFDTPSVSQVRHALMPYYRKDACINAFISNLTYVEQWGNVVYGDAFTSSVGPYGLCNNDVRDVDHQRQTTSNVVLLSTKFRDVSRNEDDHAIEFAHYFAQLTGAKFDQLGNCAGGKLMDWQVARANGEITSCAQTLMARFLERLMGSERNCLLTTDPDTSQAS